MYRAFPLPALPRGLRLPVPLAALCLGLGLVACDSGTGPAPDTKVALVQVSPATFQLQVGQSVALTATAANAAGEALAVEFAWSASPAGIVALTQNGEVTAVAPGTATVAATAGGVSGSALGAISPVPPPPAPSGLSAETESHVTINLTWLDNSADEDRFEVDRATGTGEFAHRVELPANTLALRDTGLAPGTPYRHRVRACRDESCSDWSAVAEAATQEVLVFAPSPLPDATETEPYEAALSAVGGDGSYQWSVDDGALPPGLELGESGLLSGTPTQPGTFAFSPVVVSGVQTASAEVTLLVIRAIRPPVITSADLPDARFGTPYEFVLEAIEGDGTFVWTLEGGALPPGLTLSSSGIISGTPAAVGHFPEDPDSDPIVVTVESAGFESAGELTLFVEDENPDGFDIAIVTPAPIPDRVSDLLEVATTRWEEIVVGNVPGVNVGTDFFGGSNCRSNGFLLNGTTIDDLAILVTVEVIDGPGSILASAGTCGLRATVLPFASTIRLDVADVDLLTDDKLTDLLIHEIGHTLGFGGLWNWGRNHLLVGGETDDPANDPRFVGPIATAEFAELGGGGAFVPVENTGSSGTRNVHWRESVFATELMTGYVEAAGAAPLSAMTAGSVADLGYEVDLDAADPYTLPPPAVAFPDQSERLRRSGGYDVLDSGPILMILPDGRPVRLSPPQPRSPR